MLQSIQHIGSGPPTYVYSQKQSGTSYDFYHVFAAETREYDRRRERDCEVPNRKKEYIKDETLKVEEVNMIENHKTQNLQQFYEREYGRRESFLWKQR